MNAFALKLLAPQDRGLEIGEIRNFLSQVLDACGEAGDTLLLPPDMTRLHSGANVLARELYALIHQRTPSAQVKVMPALGTHDPMSKEERLAFFGDSIPDDAYLVHDWKNGVEKIGEVPASYVKEVSEGLMNEDIVIQVNRELLKPEYKAIFSLGQVVPHEVVGMANYTKNILVGVGGNSIINQSHMLGAMYGMERMMGRMDTPVRKVFDYAQEHFLSKLPLVYILTVTTNTPEGVQIHGLFAGTTRKPYEEACALAKEKNLIFVDKPFQKCVVYLDPTEFKSTWLGNKAIYRTRMAMAQDGELIILAPGVRKFGEDPENDRLIRKYGYVGREKVIELFGKEKDLQTNQSVAAHLIHGSSDGRFSITYATTHLTKEEVEGVAFRYMPYEEAVKRYDPNQLKDGYNTLPDGEEIFYISNPALGLWSKPF